MKPIKEESISLIERTQSVSSVPKIPMDFIEFKSRYNELLSHHLNENIYHDELSFVKKWFDTYSNGFDLLQKRTKPELLTPREKRGLDILKTKNYYYDLELSFSLICKFLKQRRKEVKTELKTKSEPPQQNEIIGFDAVKKNKPDFKIPCSIMNDAILSLELSLIEDKKTVPVYVKQEQTYVPKPCFKPKSIDGTITTPNSFCFTNEFDHVPEERVYDYFKTELVDKKYLSLDDLHKYLIMAFQDKIVPNDRFILDCNGNFSKGIIRNVFYRYYTNIAQDTHGVKIKYCRLLGEYFNGFTTAKIKNNFNK